ncbi:MAG: PilN domain-containing protein [Paracoccaceae bacterium]
MSLVSGIAGEASLPRAGFDRLGAAFAWWLRALRASVPPAVLRVLGGAPERLVLCCAGRRVRLERDAADGRHPIGEADLDAAETIAALAARLGASGVAERRATLEFGPSLLVEAAATLPVAALANLDEVVRAEMDRLTPFDPERVHYAYEVLGTDEAMERLVVRLQVARRADVAERLDLCRALGLDAAAVTGSSAATSEGARSLDLLPERDRPRRGRVLARVTAGAAATCLIAGLAAALATVHRTERDLARSEALLAEATRRANAVASLEDEAARLAALAGHVVASKRARPTAIAVLDALTRTLPDRHWLDSLTIEGDALTVSGVSHDASEALRLVERSARFEDARFAASVRRDRDTGRERFAVAATIAPAAPAGPGP